MAASRSRLKPGDIGREPPDIGHLDACPTDFAPERRHHMPVGPQPPRDCAADDAIAAEDKHVHVGLYFMGRIDVT